MTGQTPFKVGPIVGRPHLRNGQSSGKWQLDIPPRCAPEGKRKRISFESRREAFEEARRLHRRLELQSTVSGPTPLPSGILLREAAKEWIDDQVLQVRAGRKRANSVDTAAFYLKPVLAFMGSSDLASISSRRLLDYQVSRTETGRRAATINSELATLRQLMTWASENNLCTKVPKVKSLPLARRRLDLPSPSEMARIIDHLPPDHALVIRFFAETGCRKSEVFHLRWRDLDFARNLVLVRAKEGFTPKTAHSERSIPIDPTLTNDLRKARGQKSREDLVFPGRGGVVRTDIEKSLKTAIRAAGVTRNEEPLHLTLHMLRKAHASWQAMRGLPESILQARLGHVPGSRITQQIYIHAAKDREIDGVMTVPRAREADT